MLILYQLVEQKDKGENYANVEKIIKKLENKKSCDSPFLIQSEIKNPFFSQLKYHF